MVSRSAFSLAATAVLQTKQLIIAYSIQHGNLHPKGCYRNFAKKTYRYPLHLDKKIEYAQSLSAGFLQVRVGLYEVDGKIYLGEITFTSFMVRMNYFIQEYSLYMGKHIHL